MADMFGVVASQNSKIHSILISETDSGSTNKVPKLLDLTDYENWKGRFETRLNGMDTNIWEKILSPYERPKVVGTDLNPTHDRLDVDQRKKYDSEKKAYWIESLEALITRYRHLLTEFRKCGIEYTEEEKIDCFAEALPKRWNSLVLILRENLPGMTLVEFIQKLEEQEMKDKRKARRVNVTRDPSLYGASVVTPPVSSAKIQTTFVSSTADSTFVPSASAGSSSSYHANEKKSDSTTTPVQSNTTNLGKVNVEVVRDHMSILSCVVSAYEEQIAGKIGNTNLTFEDYEQIDDDEMELIDTQWALASHFARECKIPKKQGNLNPLKPKEAYQKKNEKPEESTKALVSQADEGYDWGKQYDDLMGAFMASLDEETSKGKEQVEEVNNDLLEIIDKLNWSSALKLTRARAEAEMNKIKLENYQNSQYVIDYFAAMQISLNDTTGLGFHAVPPPSSYVPRPPFDPNLEVSLDSDAPIIEDITESEYSSDILRQNGYQVKNVDKKSLKSQKSKAEMKQVEKVVIKPTKVSKPVIKAKPTTTLKPIVYVKSSTTHQGESSENFRKQNVVSKKVEKVDFFFDRFGVGDKDKSKNFQNQMSNSKIKSTGLRNRLSSAKVVSKPFSSSKYYDESTLKNHLKDRKCYRCGNFGHLIADCDLDFSSIDCSSFKPFSPRETRKCFTCCGKGHISTNCPNNKIRKSSDDESWVNRSGGSPRRLRPSEDEMRVFRKYNPDCFWVKEENNQKKRVFENKRNVKKIVKIVTSSDDDSFDNASSKSFLKQHFKSKSFWNLKNRSGDEVFGKEDDKSDDGYSSRSSQKNGRGPIRETRRRNGGGHPF
ncbi:hypothetical protein E3N88_25870 [Mikania micrantha]|uniref:CCHC-type domain-containing protein n=1 Tax=Mikania micrantha TaxID=192012 RepID=A0A5N6N8Q2_9ASTR|nr:hypothetical protein E3N88_25870 [Mikania micrantha]